MAGILFPGHSVIGSGARLQPEQPLIL